MKPIRTVFVRNCRGITGVTGGETYLLSLLRGFDPDKCKCLLICIVKPEMGETSWLKQLKQTGFEHTLIPINNPFSIKDIKEVSRLVREFNADIIHCMDHRSDLVGLISAKLTGKPVIASFLGWTNFPKGSWRSIVYPMIDRIIIKRLHAVITDSVAIGEELRMWKKKDPIVAIRNGVDIHKFDPNQSLPSFSLREGFRKEGDFVVGMVGRIHPVKGHLNFLKSAKKILESQPNCRFLIVGNILPGFEYYEQEIQNYIAENNIQDSVLITHAPFDQVPAVMACLDLLAAPSFAESFSFTMLEAMAMERPVVSTNVGGATEMIADGETGFLISDDVVNSLTEKILMLIQNPALRQEVGRNARKKIVEEFSINIMAEQTLDVYQELINYHDKDTKSVNDKRELLDKLATISC